MPNLTFKPIYLPKEIAECNGFYFMTTLAVLLSRIGDDTLFSEAFSALFGEVKMMSKLLRLKKECEAYEPGTIPASLPSLIRENLCVRLADYIKANAALFSDAENPAKLHRQSDTIKQGQAPQPLTLKAFAGLLNMEVCTYTQVAPHLYLSERIIGQPIAVHFIRQDQSFQGLLDTSLLPAALIGKMSQLITYQVAEAVQELTKKEKQIPEQEAIKAIKEIKQLAKDYLVRLKYLSFDGDLQFMKHLTVEKIIYNAKTLDDIFKILSEQHEFFPSSYASYERHYSRAAVLRFNRTPWAVWFIKIFLTLITLPASIPFFMYWSWRERGTLNFLKPDGSIFMDKVLSVLKRTGLSTNIPDEPKSYSYETPSFLQGAAMQQPTISTTNPNTETSLPPISRGMGLLSTPYNPANAQTEIPDAREPYPTLEQEMQGNEAMVGAFTKMFSNHHAILDSWLRQYKGLPVIIASEPLKHIEGSQFRLTFTYQTLWTNATPIETNITVFNAFQMPRRVYNTGCAPMQAPAPTALCWPLQSIASNKVVLYGCSFFVDDFKTLLRKGDEPSLGTGERRAFYENALSKAQTDVEIVSAIEALVNLTYICIEHCENLLGIYEVIKPKLTEGDIRYYETAIAKHLNTINGYLDKLPVNYLTQSSTARIIQDYINRIWQHLEKNEWIEAYQVFKALEEYHNSSFKDYLKFNIYNDTVFTPFVLYAFPHLEVMYRQLEAMFYLSGYHDDRGASVESSDGLRAYENIQMALNQLETPSMPELDLFRSQTFKPLEDMVEQAKKDHENTPKSRIRKIAHEEWDQKDIELQQGQFHNYRIDRPTMVFNPDDFPEVMAVIKSHAQPMKM